MTGREAYVLDAVRTPFGRHGGALAAVRPDDLAAGVLGALLARSPSVDPADVDEVVLGNANGAGEDNRDVARMAVLLAGWPTSVPGVSVNRLCGSGLQAVIDASRAVAVGDADLVVAGGVESMSRAPWVVPKPARGYPAGDAAMASTTLGWRLVNPAMDPRWTIGLGESTEHLAALRGIGRERQDAFAMDSHRRAAQAWAVGRYEGHVVPVSVPGRGGATEQVATDECVRAETSEAAMAALRPAFRGGGTVTAGNSSPLSDGASAVLVGSASAAARTGTEPLARIAARAAVGVDPDVFGTGPVRAAETALARAGIGWGDVARVELNEAFAAQSLACLDSWPDLDPALVNPDGGAIALGHPLGASGGRVLAQLVHGLRATGGGWGLASLCVGVGQGVAVVVEVPAAGRAALQDGTGP